MSFNRRIRSSDAPMPNLLVEEMILFLKHAFIELDKVISDENFPMTITILTNNYNYYDGTLSSMVCHDDFWDTILLCDIQIFSWWSNQLDNYKFTLLEKTSNSIRPYIMSHEDVPTSNITNILTHYIMSHWNLSTQFKEHIKSWAQMEFHGINPK